MKTFKEQTYVLITGASAGIGRALAFEFARHGKNLLLVSLPDTGLTETIQAIKEQHIVDVHGFVCDLTDRDAPQGILTWCERNQFRVSVLVNNAGFGNLERFEKTRAEVLTNMMSLNNSALVVMTQLFIPLLKKNRRSYIMNVGSLASFMPLPGKSVYSATKSFVYAFSYSLYFELKAQNIHVSCLCPGGTLTERVLDSMEKSQLKRQKFCQLPQEVALEAVRSMYKQKFRIIPGWQNQILYWLARTLPRFAKIAIINKAFRNKGDKKTTAFRPDPHLLRSFALLNR